MEDRSTREDLPLLSRTPDDWAAMVLRDPLALLSDHAYLEKKAAANALELLNRWPEPSPPEEWTQTLASIASDEASHLNSVVRLLTERGGRLERAHRNDYARQLRQNVRKGRGHEDLLDRLLVSALIELRSCERFEVLARYCEERDPILPGSTGGCGRRNLAITGCSCGWPNGWSLLMLSKADGVRCSGSRRRRSPPRAGASHAQWVGVFVLVLLLVRGSLSDGRCWGRLPA